MRQNIKRLILLMHCPDQKGIIAAVTNFINSRNGNITYIDQYVDRLDGAFFMRIALESMDDSIDLYTFKSDFIKEFSSSLNLKCDFYQEDKLPKELLSIPAVKPGSRNI